MTELLDPLRDHAPLLAPWGAATAELINVAENLTYRVEGPDWRGVLRVHRPGYRTRRQIEAELDWMAALPSVGVETPGVRLSRAGRRVERAGAGPFEGRDLVMFDFVEGAAPAEDGDLRPMFETLGRLAARSHGDWLGFDRPRLDLPALLGPQAVWGYWRAAPNLSPAAAAVIDRAAMQAASRVAAFGTGGDRFGLIHGDMRLANLLVDGPRIRVIDFDDCGYGWRLYDLAAALSFLETRTDLGDLVDAWRRGYAAVKPLAGPAEIPSFVMLRRLALLAWVGSRIESTEPQALAPFFAEETAEVAERYLGGTLI